MLILSRVCAEFHDARGNPLFSVTPVSRNIFVDAPDAIREDPLFRMLLNDGSLEAAVPEERKKLLENNPAAGKAISPAPADHPEEKPEEKPAKTGKTAKADKVVSGE